MAEEKKYLDYDGLSIYDEKIKKLIKSEDEAVESAVLHKVEENYTAKSDLSWGKLGEN